MSIAAYKYHMHYNMHVYLDSTRFVITNFVLRDGSLPLPNPPNG